MKRIANAPTASGRWIKTLKGYRAFHPDPLPPKLNWTPKLVRALSDADQLLGRLAGEGRRLPNPHLLIRPFVQREAVFSSRIEGTQSTLGELLASDAGAVVARSPEDLREVGNYVAALEHGIARLKTLPLSLRLVRELHEKLMTGVRGHHAKPGELRRSQNWIGPPGSTLTQATYVPPPHEEMLDYLGAWEEFLHDESLPPVVQTALMHYQFEAIHPFLDGNGRVGRLLITLLLMQRGVLPLPLLYLSAFFEATRRDYYDSLRAVTERSAWEDWLLYFFNGVARQSEDALSRAERINQQLDQWRKHVSGTGTGVALRLLDLLGTNPFITVRKAEAQLGVAFNTAATALRRLVGLRIVKQVGDARRDRVFCAQALLDILEEPPRLRPG
ncbi:cell filamentation protein Fic [Verrucomicrobiota bacterium]|nr:cell filamentation protein Fic [Verrucomicrobiota bacterium]